MSLLGNYILQKTIGEGTFGKVKLGIHIPTNEKVAVKILDKNQIKDQYIFNLNQRRCSKSGQRNLNIKKSPYF